MKLIYKTFLLLIMATMTVSFSSFITGKKKPLTNAAYTISLLGKETVGSNYQWTWTVSNPNPGNGNNGTLQNVSHWSLPLNSIAESALVSAQYSYDGINWFNVSINMDRDPSIRYCTTTDVLKFDVGTSGTDATYYRITFDKEFSINTMAVSYIKTGGGLQGCNMYYYSGVGTDVISGTRND